MTGLPRTIILLASLLSCFQLAYGQAIPSPETMAKQADLIIGKMEDIKGRLQLTDDQDAQMRVILKGNVEKMRAVMQEHDIKTGADLSLEKKMSLAHDLKPRREESDKKLEAILSPDQMQEFEKIRKETLDEIEAGSKPPSD